MLKKNMSCNNFTEEIKWICPWIEENMGILLQRKESGNGDGRAGVARNPEGCLRGESYRDVTAASHRRTSSPTVPWTCCVFPTAGPWCCQFPHPLSLPPPPPQNVAWLHPSLHSSLCPHIPLGESASLTTTHERAPLPSLSNFYCLTQLYFSL